MLKVGIKHLIASSGFLLLGSLTSLTAQEFTNVVRLGFTDAAHTSSEGERYSTVSGITPNGFVFGSSRDFGGGLDILGETLWIATTAGETQRVGLYDGEHTNSGFHNNYFDFETTTGFAAGTNYRPLGGTSTWIASHSLGTTRVGLIDGIYGGPDAASQVIALNDSGVAVGNSSQFGGPWAFLTQGAWIASAETGQTVAIGLYDNTHTSEGFNHSSVSLLSASGHAAGISTRFTESGDDNGQSAWIADSSTGNTERIGLYDNEHTSSGGSQFSLVRAINSNGIVIGASVRANLEADDLGQSTWFADTTGATTQIGLYDATHQREDVGGFYSFNDLAYGSHAITGSGYILGSAERFLEEGNYGGQSAWVANASNGQTSILGLYGGEFIKDDGTQLSQAYEASQSGHVVGYSDRYAGNAAWVASETGGTWQTHRIGLYDQDHTDSNDNYQDTELSGVNNSGQVIGDSARFVATGDPGRTAWIAEANGTTTAIGLGLGDSSGTEFVNDEGQLYGEALAITESGRVYGRAHRYRDGGSSDGGLAAWTYREGTTRRLGLTDATHTSSNGYQESETVLATENFAAGHSIRYDGEFELGQTAWVYNATLDLQKEIVLSISDTGDAFADITMLFDNGFAAGQYQRFTIDGAETRLFAFHWETGAFDLSDAMADGSFASLYSLTDGNMDAFLTGIGQIYGESGQAVYLGQVAAVPEPSTYALLGTAGAYLLGGWLRRRRRGNTAPICATGMIAFALTTASGFAQKSYEQWAAGYGLTGEAANPKADPDGDQSPNALEYTVGTNPTVRDNSAAGAPFIDSTATGEHFVYRVSNQSRGGVVLQVMESADLKTWQPSTATATTVPVPGEGYSIVYHPASSSGDRFYSLAMTVNLNGVESIIHVGTNIGQGYWEGLEPIPNATIPTQPPSTGVDPNDPNTPVPNTAKYPSAAGASQGSFTPDFLAEYAGSTSARPPLRSWMGWFLWGNGTPPPGLNPGPHATKEGYGSFVPGTEWDFFNYQWDKAAGRDNGSWKPIRLDQQPLYLTPNTLHYNWAPGLFGYESQPMKLFPNNAHYWKDRRIVRGVNLSPTIPFFYQYGDKLSDNITSVPTEWHQAWMYVSSRPLETTVIVPSNFKPHELLRNADWNKKADGTYDPFPYPVWNKDLPAKDQTPFSILTDRIGSWNADLVWEATNPRATATYERDRYQRTAFNQPGKGNYLKMSVAQGSPFVWCESNNNRYAIFYNLIRTNLPGQIASNVGTGANVVKGGPWDVPGVQNVQYILLYGDHVNPNQWYQEVEPAYFNISATAPPTPGGFNQPPGNGNPGQHNHTYTAIFFRKDKVQPIRLGADNSPSGSNNGTDPQGNPFFYLEFKDTGKNWFVVGSVPEMRYYHTAVPQDAATQRETAAKAWAAQMGRYAFNFVRDTKVNYSTENMYLSKSQYQFTLQNPYVAAGDSNASRMTITPNETVFALNPHQYQPITLGPDQTKAAKPEVVWQPLQKGYGTDFPKTKLNNANRSSNAASDSSLWDYWSLRGSLKTIITKGFEVAYPFQNFLPVMPPPDYERQMEQTSIPAILITDAGSNHGQFVDNPQIEIIDHSGKGSGATAKALVNATTGLIQQIDVVSKGTGYPDGMWTAPGATGVEIVVHAPSATNGTTARAYAQVGGGQILAIFMLDNGSGYASVIKATQAGSSIDAPVIVPPFSDGHLTTGLANVIEGGAGFDFSQPIELTFYTNSPEGTPPPTAVVVKPGNLYDIQDARGGITVRGNVLANGVTPTLQVHIPPPAPGQSAQTATAVLKQIPALWSPVVTKKGSSDLGSAPTAYFEDNGTQYTVQVFYAPGVGVTDIAVDPANPGQYPTLTGRRQVIFSAGGAEAWVYPTYFVDRINLNSPLVEGYQSDVQITLTGGDFSDVPGVTVPTFDFTINPDGTVATPTITNGGSGIANQIDFEITGGMGLDAVLLPVLGSNGDIAAVRVLQGGNNYLSNVYAYVENPGHQGTDAELAVNVDPTTGTILSITVPPGKGGSGYTNGALVKLTSVPPPWDHPPDFVNLDNPKGVPTRFSAVPTDGVITSVIRAGLPAGKVWAKYFPGTEGQATTQSIPAYTFWVSNTPFARASGRIGGFFGRPAPLQTSVSQVLYSSMISQYTTLTGKDVAPMGGAFFGLSAPDGYGLGNQLSAATKFVGDIYNYQKFIAAQGSDIPNGVNPSGYALNDAGKPQDSYAAPIFQEHNPFSTLSGALKTSIQGMQKTVTQLFTYPASQNNPADGSPNTWKEDYFSMFDSGVGRILINPTSTQPVWGVVSSVENPAAIPDSENASKEGLSKWQNGMLWSGFGVSDQWNDQHYFYGYYLGAAAQAALFDYSWEPQLNGKPSVVWADANQMGTAIDQVLMSLAYDPDNTALTNVLYKNSNFVYQKFAFFDQWNGHPWATGLSPGTTVAERDYENDPFAYWRSFGTDNDKYRDENENSAFEGLQAWSATILWGGASDRKAVVDLGIYLYSNTLAAADSYFLDKNYNLANNKDLQGNPNNRYSWVPVTTTPSANVAANGGNTWPANTNFVSGTPEAYYTAPEFFGGAASTGQSLIKKPENTLNNFFYAFPTGSKFIQAFPPTPWTLGMARNSTYMRKWAGSMMREEWANARDSALFQPANWLSMAMTSAISGVLYNPGDQPYPMLGTTPNTPLVKPYSDRLWSSWVTANSAPGASAAMMPTFLPSSVLTFLLAFQDHGTADWTYIAKVTDASGVEDNHSVVFTAAFTKPGDSGTVQTTFVAFNPGWSKRYVQFYRLNPDGTIQPTPITGSTPITVEPKGLATHKPAPFIIE